MNVLFISHEATRTGAPLVLLSLLQDLKQRHSFKFETLLLEDGVLYKDFAALSNTILLKKKKTLAKRIHRRLSGNNDPYPWDYSFLSKSKYDCIFANTIASLPVAAQIKKKVNIPLLLYVHEARFSQDHIGLSDYDIQACDIIIAVSNKVKKDLATYHGIDEDSIRVIHPFSPFSDDITPKFPTHNGNRLTVGMAGIACWIKGIDLVPLVAKDFSLKYPNIDSHFVWVGEIDMLTKKKVIHDAEHLGVASKISFIPCQENPLPKYAQFDVFLLLSREDSFPLVCLENAILGNPIICMEGASGITDMLNDNAGIIVPYMSLGEISKALYTLYTDKSFASNIAKKAREIALTKFSKKNSAEAIIKLIENMHS